MDYDVDDKEIVPQWVDLTRQRTAVIVAVIVAVQYVALTYMLYGFCSSCARSKIIDVASVLVKFGDLPSTLYSVETIHHPLQSLDQIAIQIYAVHTENYPRFH